jgi:hypothetical protein
MASETFKKRQKETARREKQQKKFARRLERKNDKGRTETETESESGGENPEISEQMLKHGPTIL